MTPQTPQPDDAHNSPSTVPREASNAPAITLHPHLDSTSDNDASERATREQLKKTSIASLSKHVTEFQNMIPTSDDVHMSISDSTRKDQSPEKEDISTDIDTTRGRPVRKRSFDDLEAADAEVEKRETSEKGEEKWNSHIRKRSRDIRAGEPFKEDGRSRGITIPVQEEAEDATDEKESHEPMDSSVHAADENIAEAAEAHSNAGVEEDGDGQDVREPARQDTVGTTTPIPKEGKSELMDQEMRDSTASPQKKRSRDQFDSDPDREQKIAATEETRAHRRSDEIDRAKLLSLNCQPLLQHQGFTTTQNEPQVARASTAEAETKKAPSIFGSTSALTAIPARTGSPSKSSSDDTSSKTDQQSQTSTSAFAASGFAALSKSTTSPFGTVGATSVGGGTPSPFASASAFSPKKADPHVPKTTETKTNGGFGSFAKASSSGFGSTEPSPFGTAGAAKPAIFGGSVFGGGFGGVFGGGGRLSNFAAPTGDAKLGAANGAVKPIGSPTREEDDDEDSENEGECFGGSNREGNDEADERFQHQDVETGEDGEESIFSSRASLYAFRNKMWKESGKGTFKLNVFTFNPNDPDSTQRKGRFIMRAHQTYRVLLNAPIFKGMQIGDGRGNLPTGKSFAFGVVEDGMLIPHMVKLGDLNESKTLYHEVRKIQDGLTEP
ncbi:hypothetical protein N7G274_001027 [Stereocaulon virgatum]|uniref:RanBD1 domain-containing protein n=1 Tax=Stereocaulon virgatum TaxID=373712 RepID=A0ABR4AMN8_9LECA